MDRKRFALIGAGLFGERHAQAYSHSPYAELAAVCDRREDRAQEIAEQYGAGRAVTDHTELRCARVVFNDAIAARRAAHEAGEAYPTDGALSKALTAAKRTPERAWLGEVSAAVLQQALADANTAYRNFFASVKGARKGRKLGTPRFRSKRDRAQSIRFTKAARFRVLPNHRLRLPAIGDVPVRWSRDMPSEPSSVTVIVDAAERYHASFVVEAPDEPLRAVDREVGIDLGLTHFAVLSDGTKLDAPRIARKAAARLRTAQKELARRQKGSANREKSRRKVARAHARVADTRRDWLHKLSTTIVRENQAVYVEDLAVSGLARTRLARSVHDAGWSTFVGMLAYKAQRHGRTFARVDRWFPSTRACLTCGAIGEAKPLHVRQWTCTCGAVHDRDVNAARNILAAGRADSPTLVELVSAGTPVPQPAVKREPAREHGMSRADRNPCRARRGGRQNLGYTLFVVLELAAAGDPATQQIADQAGADLTALVRTVAGVLGSTGPLVCAGGLITHQPALLARLRADLAAAGVTDVRLLDRNPVHGAVRLALRA